MQIVSETKTRELVNDLIGQHTQTGCHHRLYFDSETGVAQIKAEPYFSAATAGFINTRAEREFSEWLGDFHANLKLPRGRIVNAAMAEKAVSEALRSIEEDIELRRETAYMYR